MSSPPLPDLDALSADGLKRLVARLLARVVALEEENRQLRDENARLKDLPKRPKLAPGGMDRATEPASRAGARRRRRTGRGGRRTPPATEERVLTVAAPPGSRRKGYEPYTVQDLVLAPRVIRYRRERWVTPDGRELVAPLPPEVAGHFGPGVVRYILMQHVQGQVTVERLLAQLRALGVRIAKGQLVALLTARKDAFHAETDAILEAGLATARWVTVDDTGARHAGRDETTTHVGDDRFADLVRNPGRGRPSPRSGGYVGARCRMRSGSQGTAAASGILRRAPRESQNDTPSLAQGFSRPREVSRARLPAAERVPPEILRLVTRQRMSLSEPLVCSGISGRSSTTSSSSLLARRRATVASSSAKPVTRPKTRSNRARRAARRAAVGSSR